MDQSELSPQPNPEPQQEFVSARARRRRAQRRAYFPSDEEGRGALFTHLARRAYPSYELFVFSLVSGVILGLGYFLDSEALLFFGILVAPLMTPWIGISLATLDIGELVTDASSARALPGDRGPVFTAN